MNPISQSDLIFHLEKAIENGEFEAYYQPIIHTISGSLCGFEALVRWKHAGYGFLMPTQFIAALEESRQIFHLDLHLIECVAKRLRTEREAGRPVVPVSINLSRVDFQSTDMLRIINDIVARYGIPRGLLNIEITESAFSDDEQLMAKTIADFRSAGYQVWMDDFGSGYSSLNTLKDYEFDELKIDMKFMSTMSIRSKRILSSVISMAKNIGMVTLVEGVETEEQVRFLRSIGCDRMQGFYFSGPLPYDEIIRLLEDRRIPFETAEDRQYYHEVNRVNLLSPSPFNVKEKDKESHGGGIPLAIIEERNGSFQFLYQNEEFVDDLKSLGASNATDAIQKLVHFGILNHKAVEDFLYGAIKEGDKHIEFNVNGDICSARAKLISKSTDRNAILVSITNITRAMDISHEQVMDQRLRNIYSLYLRVTILRPRKNELVTVFAEDGYPIPIDVTLDLGRRLSCFCEKDVSPRDREAYKAFVDPGTIEERIRRSRRGFINVKLHTRDYDGSNEFSNKMYIATATGNHEILLLVRYANL
jgi:EAL domain-containing protein (putative c-di-GMP-specific phosphodiesterase class I)